MAAYALVELRDPTVALPLLEALQTEGNLENVDMLTRALCAQREPSIVEPLLRMAAATNRDQQVLAFAVLAGLSNPRAIDTLFKALASRESSIRANAVTGLGYYRGSAIILPSRR